MENTENIENTDVNELNRSLNVAETGEINGIKTQHPYGDYWNCVKTSSDNDITYNIYTPDVIDNNTPVIVYIPGQEQIQATPIMAAGEYNTDAIIIVPKVNSYYGDKICQDLADFSKNIPGDWNNITAAGVSVGGARALDVTIAANTNDYGININTCAWNESQQIWQTEQGGKPLNPTDEQFKALADNNVTLIGLADSEGKTCFKTMEEYRKNGGVNNIMVEYNGGSHDNNCHNPYTQGNYFNYLIGKGDIPEDFKEKLRFFTNDGTGKKDTSYEKTEEIIKGKNHDKENMSNIISVDYAFVEEYTSLINNAIMKTNLLSNYKVAIPTDGSQTFSAANEAFANYSAMSKNFLGSLSATNQNIMLIAESMSNLDSDLANSIGDYFSAIDSVDLSSYKSFYQNIPELNIFSDTSGDIKISREKLMEAASTGNALISNLMADINDTYDIQSELDKFISDSSSKLEGEAWNKVRNKVSEYSEICQDKQNYASKLIDSMINAYNKLLEYMQYDELDTSKIPEVKQEITNLKTQLEELETALANASAYVDEFSGYDKDGNATYVKVPNPLIPQLEKAIKLCNEVITEAENYLEQLEGLKDADNEAAEGIRDTEAEQPDIVEDTNANIPQTPVGEIGNLDAEKLDDTSYNNNSNNTNENATEENTTANEIGGVLKSNTETKEENVTEEKTEVNEFPAYNDITTNDKQDVYNVNNECKLIISHENDNVNGVEFYYDFHDKATADTMYNQIVEKYQNLDGFDKVIQDNGNIKVIFNDSYYGGHTIEDFNDVYSNYYNKV